MADVVTFDPVNLRIVEINSALAVNTLTAKEVYSEWKAWLLADPSRLGYPAAFTPIGGDPTTGSDALGVTLFLENRWKIRPAEYNHKLIVDGNVFDRAGGSIFATTLGAYNVHTETKVSNLIDRVTLGGVDQATVQAALTAQGYTTTRAPKIDQLDAAMTSRAVAGQGLTNEQMTMLLEMFRLMGLDPSRPLVVNSASRTAGGSISQTISEASGTVTVTRV